MQNLLIRINLGKWLSENVCSFLKTDNTLALLKFSFFYFPFLKAFFVTLCMPPKTVKDILALNIPKKLLELVPRSYDLIGTIAIVEIKPELKKYERAIAKAIMEIHKPIKTVLKKASAMEGKYRVRSVKILAGEKTTVTTYREHGCLIKLDVAKVYFSVRLSHERERISSFVHEKENVLVMFAGVGPFALVIAKKHKGARVAGVELNPTAVRYFKENIKLNKLHNCEAIKGDVKKIIPTRFANFADRVIMPLPHSAETFLDSAFLAAKDGAVIHFYAMVDEGDMPHKIIEIISQAAKENGIMIEILNWKIVRPYAPHISQVVIDFKVKK